MTPAGFTISMSLTVYSVADSIRHGGTCCHFFYK